jgi:integrase
MGSAGRRVCMDDALARILAVWKNSQRLNLEHINGLRLKHSMEPLALDSLMPVVNGKYGQRIDPDGFDKFFRNFCVDSGWGEYTKDVVTKTYGGRTFTRGKGYRGLTVHELRHTVASLLVAEGLDVKTVQAQLGHKSASTTLNIYAHAFEERSREAGNTIGRLLNG